MKRRVVCIAILLSCATLVPHASAQHPIGIECTRGGYAVTLEQVLDDRDRYYICLINSLMLAVENQRQTIATQEQRIRELSRFAADTATDLQEKINDTDRRYVRLLISLGYDPMTEEPRNDTP